MRYRPLFLVAPLALAGCLDFDQFQGGGDTQLGLLDGAHALRDFGTGPDDLVVTHPSDLGLIAADSGPACVMPSRSCYTGPGGTVGVGVCRAGVSTCTDGVFGPCVGEIVPSGEACNGEDDDCDGVIDNLPKLSCGVGACTNHTASCLNGAPATCTPLVAGQEKCDNGIDDDCNGLIDEPPCGCILVAPNGNDANGTGSLQSPFRSIAKAISVAGSMNTGKTICVASGAVCPSTFSYSESIQMRDGVSVYGGYSFGNGLIRNKSCVTTINDIDAVGVHFDRTIKDPTILDGFTINGFAAQSSAAVTIEGSTAAQVSNDVITGGGTQISMGIEIDDQNGVAATPLITHDAIVGGGAPQSYGIHVVNSAPLIQSNCDGFDNLGRCNVGGCSSTTHYIQGRDPKTMGSETYGVFLDGSPGTVIDSNGICATGGSSLTAGVGLAGAAKGTVVRANSINGGGNTSQAIGVLMLPCNSDAPWIFDNVTINAMTGVPNARADGVRAQGDCHPVIDGNQLIGADGEQKQVTDGIFCALDSMSGIASRCSIQRNLEIDGAASGNTMTSIGVVCDDGACARIERNEMITAHLGQLSMGLALGRTGVFVDSNVISAGCSVSYAYGIATQDSFARIQNNRIAGSSCAMPSNTLVSSVGVSETMIDLKHEVDLHSNDLFAGGDGAAMCTSAAVVFNVGQNVKGSGTGGIVRNNILDVGACPTRYGYLAGTAGVQVRVVENNDFSPVNKPTALWHDQVMNDVQSIDVLNALAFPGTSIGGNLSGDPLLAVSGKLSLGSPCIDTGTPEGAPSTDAFGNPRPHGNGYDIGLFEY